MSCSVPESPLSEDIVTTIFVVGFPDDFREREFQNLFAFAKGFEGCALRLPASSAANQATAMGLSQDDPMACFGGGTPQESPTRLGSYTGTERAGTGPRPVHQPIGFARFRSVGDAAEACRQLHGRIVDLERGSTLKAEMAKKNLYIAPTRSRSAMPFGPSFGGMLPTAEPGLLQPPFSLAAGRRASLATSNASGGFGSCSSRFCEECSAMSSIKSLNLCVPGQPSPIPICAPSIASPVRYQDCPHQQPSGSKSAAMSGGGSPTLVSGGGMAMFAENPPCNTLYVGNLPINASEVELRTIFSNILGFRRMSFKPKFGSSPMCFVEFEDITKANAAIEMLYGTMLSNSTKGGIRLSFSKNPLGVRSPPSSAMGTAGGSSLFADLFPSPPSMTTSALDLAGTAAVPCLTELSVLSPSYYQGLKIHSDYPVS